MELNDVTFTTLADFSTIFRAFGHLKFLSANDLEYKRQMDPETASDVGCNMPALTPLRVNSAQPTTVVDWLFRYNTFPSLRRVECNYVLSVRDDSQAIDALWENAGCTLEQISINISKGEAGTPFPLEVIGKSAPPNVYRPQITLADAQPRREAARSLTLPRSAYSAIRLPPGAQYCPRLDVAILVSVAPHKSHSTFHRTRISVQLARSSVHAHIFRGT